MIKEYILYSLKSIRTRKLRSWLTMIGIFIGIAAIVSLISLGEGMRNAITAQFSNLGTDKITIQAAGTHFGPPGSGAVKKLTTKESDIVGKVKDVRLVADRMIRTVKMEYKGQQNFEAITSMPEGEAGKLVVDAMQIKRERGRMITDKDSFKAVVGYNFFSKDRFDKPVDVGSKIKLNNKEFEVVGILERSGNPIVNNIISIPDKTFRRVLDVGDEVDMIVAQIQPGADINKVIGDIEKGLRKARDVEMGKEDFSVESAQQTIQSVQTILDVVTYILLGIAAISLLVGGIGVMNTMFTSVLERKRHIGIMKSIGAKNSSILGIFLIESGLLGASGGAVGVLLGAALGKIVENIGKSLVGTELLRADFSFGLVLGAIVFSFVVGCIAGILPAMRASKLNPVDALRK